MHSSHIQILLWAFPIALSVHVFEEFAYPGGFIEWVKSNKPRRLKSTIYYVSINAAAILGAAVIALRAADIVGYSLFLYSMALMGGNAATHIRGSIQKRQYCPGSVTGALVLLPLLVVGTLQILDAGLVNLTLAVVCVGIGFFIGFFIFSADIRKQDRI